MPPRLARVAFAETFHRGLTPLGSPEFHLISQPRTRFFLALAAFLAWIGYLGYLVAITRDPIILSRPQFLPANVYVLAQLTGNENPDKTVSFIEVPWSADGMGPAIV